jgi:hypothetical protein
MLIKGFICALSVFVKSDIWKSLPKKIPLYTYHIVSNPHVKPMAPLKVMIIGGGLAGNILIVTKSG